MKNIANFGVLAPLVIAFGLSACVAQGDPGGEVSPQQMTTESDSVRAAVAPAVRPESSMTKSLPTSESSSQQTDLFPPPCSICSDFSCQTHSLGSVCDGGTCQQLSDRTCHTDGLITCKCVSGVP